jgi:hypothetical protein
MNSLSEGSSMFEIDCTDILNAIEHCGFHKRTHGFGGASYGKTVLVVVCDE